MKKMAILAIVFATTWLVTVDLKAQPPAEESSINQGALAVILAHKLGLAGGLPVNTTPDNAINMLMQAGISPREGWDAGADVTQGTLAYLLASVLGLSVTDWNDDTSVVEACIAANIDFTSVGTALLSAGIISSSQRQGQPTGSQLNDPLYRLPPGLPSDMWNASDNNQAFQPKGKGPLTPN